MNRTTSHKPTVFRYLRSVALMSGMAWFSIASKASSATVEVGSHFLLANTPGQIVQVQVSGGEDVGGADLFFQVGDGGPELVNVGLPAGSDGPEVGSVDVVTDTIFDVSSAVQIDFDRSGVVQVFFSSVALVAPPGPSSVVAEGVLANVSFDTTGISTGTFDLLLSDVLPNLAGGPFDTTLLGTGGSAVPTTVNNGSLVVVAPSDADFNSDGDVDGDDFLKWQRGFGTGTTFAEGDADFDGDVDGSDLSIWSFLYSGNIAPVAAVSAVIPEPTSCSLALACFVTISGLSHRRTS